MIVVELYCDSLGTHLMQIYSGLYLLCERGEIKLKLKAGSEITGARPNRQFIFMRVYFEGWPESAATCLFDMQDSPRLGLQDGLEHVDFYVKRSLEPEIFSLISPAQQEKLIPFGFNYQVLSYSPAFFLKVAALEFFSCPFVPWAKKNDFHWGNLKAIFAALFLGRKTALLSGSEISPQGTAKTNGGVFFQCRLWDVDDVSKSNREDTEQVNQTRIQLLRRLKAEFGPLFSGGLQNTRYARQHAPELISPLPAGRKAYLELVREASVVISTTGLLKSNGWKLGEYIALGKAIVSEPIHTLLPRGFEEGKNYLAFADEEACVLAVRRLLECPELICDMERENRAYYERYLEPSALMKHHINGLMEQCGASSWE